MRQHLLNVGQEFESMSSIQYERMNQTAVQSSFQTRLLDEPTNIEHAKIISPDVQRAQEHSAWLRRSFQQRDSPVPFKVFQNETLHKKRNPFINLLQKRQLQQKEKLMQKDRYASGTKSYGKFAHNT